MIVPQPLPTLATLTSEAMAEIQRSCFIPERKSAPPLRVASLPSLCTLTHLLESGVGNAEGPERYLAIQAYCVAAEVLRRVRPYESKQQLDSYLAEYLAEWNAAIQVMQDPKSTDLECDAAADAVEDLLMLLCIEAAQIPSA